MDLNIDYFKFSVTPQILNKLKIYLCPKGTKCQRDEGSLCGVMTNILFGVETTRLTRE